MTSRLEVIVGPMFSGKSTELLRRLRRAEIAKLSTILIRPGIDSTKTTHDGLEHRFYYAESSKEFEGLAYGYDVVGIDEVQFFDDKYAEDRIVELAKDYIVIVAGLDTDFRYLPFGIVPNLMAYAERVDKLTAICHCGVEATRSQRIVNGHPASILDPQVMVGEEELYEARCSSCWNVTNAILV